MSCSQSLEGTEGSVTLSGYSNDECGLCTSFNDTFILSREPHQGKPALANYEGYCCNPTLCQVQYYEGNYYVSDDGCIAYLQITLSIYHNCVQDTNTVAVTAIAKNILNEFILTTNFYADNITGIVDCGDFPMSSFTRDLCLNPVNSEDCSESCCGCGNATSVDILFP